MMAAIYDWSGFYIGLNGGGATSRNCWNFVGGGSEGCHDATGGTVGGQIGYRWQTGPVVFGVEAQGNWADFRGDNVSLLFPGDRNRTKIDAFRSVHRSDRLRLEQRAALREGRCRCDRHQVRHSFDRWWRVARFGQ